MTIGTGLFQEITEARQRGSIPRAIPVRIREHFGAPCLSHDPAGAHLCRPSAREGAGRGRQASEIRSIRRRALVNDGLRAVLAIRDEHDKTFGVVCRGTPPQQRWTFASTRSEESGLCAPLVPTNGTQQRQPRRSFKLPYAVADLVFCGPPGDRTQNPRIKSPLLCQLS